MDRFHDLNTQLIVLSRRNSNVRSLALSLGKKRVLTARCEESLHAIQDALSKQGFATMNMGPNEFGKFYASETAKWAKLVEELGLAH